MTMDKILSSSKYVGGAFLAVAAFLPSFVFAQGVIQNDLSNNEGFGGLLVGLADLVNNFLVPLFITIAVLVFIYGVFKYFILGGAAEDKEPARNLMLYALLGFVAIVALWGIVNFLVDAFGFDDEDTIFTPAPIDIGG